MVDTSEEAFTFQAAIDQLYSRDIHNRVAGLKFLIEDWKMFDAAWLHCLDTLSKQLLVMGGAFRGCCLANALQTLRNFRTCGSSPL